MPWWLPFLELTDETTHMKFVQNLLFSCFRFQSPLPSTISRAAHAARCGSNNQLTDMSSLENNDLVIVERNIPCLGDGKSGFWNPFCCIGKWYPNGCVAKICWDFIARKTPSHWGVTTLPGSPFQSMLAPDPQIKRVKSFNTHKTSKNASKWTKYPKKVVGKWSRLPSLGDDFWFVLLQTKIAHLGSASNICALRLENLEKHISPMAKEWQTKLKGWKVKTTPTHTVFFYLQHDAVKHGWTMSLD